jgi:hypothetical protein
MESRMAFFGSMEMSGGKRDISLLLSRMVGNELLARHQKLRCLFSFF